MYVPLDHNYSLVMVVLGTTIHEFARNNTNSTIENS